MKKIFLLILLIFVVGWSVSSAAQSRETLTLVASDMKTLRIDCGAGYLKVLGVAGLEQIEVAAVLNVSGIADDELTEFKKEFVTLKLEKVSGQAELTAKIESDFSLASLFGHSGGVKIRNVKGRVKE